MLVNDCALRILFHLIKTKNNYFFASYFAFYLLYQKNLTNNGIKKNIFFNLLKEWQIPFYFSLKIKNNQKNDHFLFLKIKDQLHLIKIVKIFKNIVIFYDPFFKFCITTKTNLLKYTMSPTLVVPKFKSEKIYFFEYFSWKTKNPSLKFLFLDLFLFFNYLSFSVLFHFFFLSTYEITNLLFYLLLSFLIYFSKLYCEKKILKAELILKVKTSNNFFSLIKICFLFLLLFICSSPLFFFFLSIFLIFFLMFLLYKYYLIFNFNYQKISNIRFDKNKFIFLVFFLFIIFSIIFKNILFKNQEEYFFLFTISYFIYFFYLEIGKLKNFFLYFE